MGKSTALQNYIKSSGKRAAGFVTLRIPDALPKGPSVHMFLAAPDGKADLSKPPDEDNLLFYCAQKTPCPEIGERFDRIGCYLLDRMPPDSELIILDEIGPAEQYALAFRKRIMKLLDGEIPVVGVLQENAGDFATQIKMHPQVEILEVHPWWE